jgi:hypothetical protein
MKRAAALLVLAALGLGGCTSTHDQLAHERAIIDRACAPGPAVAEATGHGDFYDQNC